MGNSRTKARQAIKKNARASYNINISHNNAGPTQFSRGLSQNMWPSNSATPGYNRSAPYSNFHRPHGMNPAQGMPNNFGPSMPPMFFQQPQPTQHYNTSGPAYDGSMPTGSNINQMSNFQSMNYRNQNQIRFNESQMQSSAQYDRNLGQTGSFSEKAKPILHSQGTFDASQSQFSDKERERKYEWEETQQRLPMNTDKRMPFGNDRSFDNKFNEYNRPNYPKREHSPFREGFLKGQEKFEKRNYEENQFDSSNNFESRGWDKESYDRSRQFGSSRNDDNRGNGNLKSNNFQREPLDNPNTIGEHQGKGGIWPDYQQNKFDDQRNSSTGGSASFHAGRQHNEFDSTNISQTLETLQGYFPPTKIAENSSPTWDNCKPSQFHNTDDKEARSNFDDFQSEVNDPKKSDKQFSDTEDSEDLRLEILRLKQKKIEEQLEELERKSKETDRKLGLLERRSYF